VIDGAMDAVTDEGPRDVVAVFAVLGAAGGLVAVFSVIVAVAAVVVGGVGGFAVVGGVVATVTVLVVGSAVLVIVGCVVVIVGSAVLVIVGCVVVVVGSAVLVGCVVVIVGSAVLVIVGSAVLVASRVSRRHFVTRLGRRGRRREQGADDHSRPDEDAPSVPQVDHRRSSCHRPRPPRVRVVQRGIGRSSRRLDTTLPGRALDASRRLVGSS
jgi:hypothetical protein